MPLGIEQNNIAPQLIQNSGAALVQGIRQIGQQISGHLTEIQTKRDLGAMAQEMQGLNVQSNEFPVQLTQMLSRHPLAAKDERGQMALSILGKAHGQWQAGEAEARAFNRAMALQGYRDRSATARAEAARDAAASRTKVGNKIVDLRDPENPVTVFETDPLNPPMPFASTPQGIMDRRTGTITSPPPNKGLTPGQAVTDARLAKKNKIDLLLRQDSSVQTEINNSIKRRDALTAEKNKLGEDADNAYYDNTIKAIEGEVEQLRKRRLDIQKEIEGVESTPAEVSVNAEAEILPPLTSAAAAPASVEMIAVIDPQGRPGKVKASQLEAALQNGYKRR